MTERLAWAVTLDGDVTRVELTGSIDEDSGFAALAKELSAATTIRFDLAGIRRINSCGVREWVNFVRSLTAPHRIEIERCSPVVVSQMNMISNFVGTARVLSVQASFVCEKCDHEESVLLNVEKGQRPALGVVVCPRCGVAMEFDDVEESYFSFLL